MLDWLTKELVGVYYSTNINDDRKCTKSVRINGRLYDKHGINCATTAIALVYKVNDPCINHNKYVLLLGVARQSPYDTVLDKELGFEIAMENAMLDPVMKVEYSSPIDVHVIKRLLTSYVSGLEVKFVKTRAEILEEKKDMSIYQRNNKIVDNQYYNDYYKDFKKIFLKDE